MATIEEVARKAEVSRQTVSRFINNSGYVGAATRERLTKVIQELNYRPNMLAKALVTRHSYTIAHVMTNISDPFHNLVNQGFEKIAFQRGYTSMMCDAHSYERVCDYIRMFQDHCIGGVVFHHLDITDSQVMELKQSGIKCVLMDNETEVIGVSSLVTDNYRGGYMAAEHLIEKGHTRIACVHGCMKLQKDLYDVEPPYEDTFQFNIWKQRTKGFIDAMRAYGLKPVGFYQSHGRFEYAVPCAARVAEQILEQVNAPTALYCENDLIAISLLAKFQEKGIKVPEDIALIGHDGLDLCKILHPYITTVVQPRYEMGKRSANILIDEIENRSEMRNEILLPQIEQGETT